MTPEALSKKFKWIRVSETDGVLEFFCDHHILQSVRTCEAYFIEGIVNSLQTNGRAWSLEFGQWFHKSMEYFDEFESKRLENAHSDYLAEWVSKSRVLWTEMRMDEHQEKKQYKTLKGWPGAQLLLLQYWDVYGKGQERLRTVGTELGFGKDREVPILLDSNKYVFAPFRAFYTGRIDRAVDNGSIIGPMDRKTTAYFDGTEGSDFKPHEGMQGYVYALARIVDKVTNGEASRLGRLCNSMIIDHVSLRECATNPAARFKRSIKNYTSQEMEQWRLRQISTFSRIYELLVLERTPDRNTPLMCTNMYYHNCPYKMLHEVDELQRPVLINAFYNRREEWNPYPEAEESQSS